MQRKEPMKEDQLQSSSVCNVYTCGVTRFQAQRRKLKKREDERRRGGGGYLVTVLVEEGGEEGDVAANEGQNEEALHEDGKAVPLVKVQYAAHVCCSGLCGGCSVRRVCLSEVE